MARSHHWESRAKADKKNAEIAHPTAQLARQGAAAEAARERGVNPALLAA